MVSEELVSRAVSPSVAALIAEQMGKSVEHATKEKLEGVFLKEWRQRQALASGDLFAPLEP